VGHDGQGRALPGTGRPGPVEPGAHGRDRAGDGMMRRLERADSSNAEPVDPVIGTPHLGQSIVECEKLIGTRSAKGIMASGRVSRIHRPNTWLPRPALLLQRSLTTRSRPHMTQSRRLSAVCSNAAGLLGEGHRLRLSTSSATNSAPALQCVVCVGSGAPLCTATFRGSLGLSLPRLRSHVRDGTALGLRG
jgi:hypothetical protein